MFWGPVFTLPEALPNMEKKIPYVSFQGIIFLALVQQATTNTPKIMLHVPKSFCSCMELQSPCTINLRRAK